jgi:hypothetical protein
MIATLETAPKGCRLRYNHKNNEVSPVLWPKRLELAAYLT